MSCVTTNTCGCLYPSNTDCVFVKGIDANCLSINNGDLLSDAINKINTAICDFEPNPSGLIYNVVACGSNSYLTVSPVAVGDTTTFTVCFDDSTINTMQNDISVLSGCVSNSITEIAFTTDATNFGLSATDTGASGCGRQWTIDYTGTPTAIVDGIISNDFTEYSLPGAGILAFFNYDYAGAGIAVGDEIRFEIIGSVESSPGGVVDELVLEFFDQDTATVIGSASLANIFGAGRSSFISTYRIQGTINIETISNPIYNSFFVQVTTFPTNYTNAPNPPYIGSPNFLVIPKSDFTVTNGVELNNLTIRVTTDGAGAGQTPNNSIRKFMVEVRKKI